MNLLIILYLSIVASLVWGRLRFFSVDPGMPRLTALGYDLAVITQMAVTFYYMANVTQITKMEITAGALAYALALFLFWWSIRTARSLDFAFSSKVGAIVTTGPFGWVRHPFYTSYILVWLTSSLLFRSPILWITLIYLVTFYFLSARREERIILESDQGKSYRLYQNKVGMFLPRIKSWKRSHSKP
ncbi:MAG: isoprenylcysteine carboxylmethyltransferase family protein [Pseudohongiellaceae bacterium]